MSKVNIDINTEDLEKILDQLSGNEMMTAQRRALSRAGRLLYKAAKQNAASSVPKVRQSNPKYTDTMYEGVRMSVAQENDFKWYFKVHILGTRKKTSGTFRLRFFEGGTVPRKTKNAYTDKLGRTYPPGINRGKLRATNFFANAISSSESQVVTAIQENLVEEIKKIQNNNT